MKYVLILFFIFVTNVLLANDHINVRYVDGQKTIVTFNCGTESVSIAVDSQDGEKAIKLAYEMLDSKTSEKIRNMARIYVTRDISYDGKYVNYATSITTCKTYG
jgi:hypothetical protein